MGEYTEQIAVQLNYMMDFFTDGALDLGYNHDLIVTNNVVGSVSNAPTNGEMWVQCRYKPVTYDIDPITIHKASINGPYQTLNPADPNYNNLITLSPITRFNIVMPTKPI